MTTDIEQTLIGDLDRIRETRDCEALVSELRTLLNYTAETILKMAAIVVRLEELGHDLDELGMSILPQLRRIGHGQMSASLFIEMSGKPSLLNRLSQLPMPDQEAIAAGETVKVMAEGGSHRMVRPDDMTTEEVRQVFAFGKVRSDAEQVGILKARETVRTVDPPEPITLDKRRRGIVVGDRFIHVSDLAHYLSQLTETSGVQH